jgi:hypothetical protein
MTDKPTPTIRVSRADVLAQDCPTCGARSSVWCERVRMPNIGQVMHKPHTKRIEVARRAQA